MCIRDSFERGEPLLRLIEASPKSFEHRERLIHRRHELRRVLQLLTHLMQEQRRDAPILAHGNDRFPCLDSSSFGGPMSRACLDGADRWIWQQVDVGAVSYTH